MSGPYTIFSKIKVAMRNLVVISEIWILAYTV